ncbi:hypothetical protein D6T65_15785 [Arthrobacter frigidicola]|nr:hypothetical protein D6T65_15785 [Arthrobacter frigidicola]
MGNEASRVAIMTELAERARRDFEIRVRMKAELDAEQRAAISPERRAALGLTEEHFRQAEEHLGMMQALDRERLEQGINYFSTFSLDILEAFLTDLNQGGPFAKAHSLDSRIGTAGFIPQSHQHGLQGFLATYRHYYVDERYIRDYLTFRPADPKIIRLTWEALGLKAPTGLTETADRLHSGAKIGRLLLVSQALHSTQYEYATRNLETTGYSRGDEIEERTRHLRWMSPGFAKYILKRNPDDQALARKLTGRRKDLFSLTLEGVSEERFLRMLAFFTSTAYPGW